MANKTEEKKEECSEQTVPLGGYYECWTAKKTNQLVMSGEWFVKEVCSNGKYILVRKK